MRKIVYSGTRQHNCLYLYQIEAYIVNGGELVTVQHICLQKENSGR